MTFKDHLKATLKLAWPMMVGHISGILMGITDSIMIAKLSHVHLSASNLANSICWIIVIVGLGIANALSPKVAESNARNDSQEAKEWLKAGLRAGAFAGVILAFLVIIISFFVPYMGQPPEEEKMATSYLLWLGISNFPWLLFMILKQYMDGLEDPKPGMWITFFALFLNVFLNYLFIEGHFGFPRLELAGAGIATFLSRCVMLALIFFYIRNKYGVLGHFRELKEKTTLLFKTGIPLGIQYFNEVCAFSMVTIFIGWLSDASISRAAHQVALGMVGLAYMLINGVAGAAAVRVANHIGAKDVIGVRRAGWSSLFLAFIIMCFIAGCFILFKNELIGVYRLEKMEVIVLASSLLIIAAAFEIFDGIQGVALGLLRGLEDSSFPTWLTSIVYWIVCLPLSYYLCIHTSLGVIGIWWSFLFSLVIISTLLTWRFYDLTKGKYPKWLKKN
jgi:multidrug resistance protein, MATE family